jgi:hypothetical protein
MAVGKASKSQEAYYSKYKTLYPENRKRKLQRVLKAQPDNEQVKMALKDIHYRRKTPNSVVWSSSSRRMAQMLRDWTGYFDMAILNSNPKVSSDAMQKLPSRAPAIKPDDSLQAKHMFSLKTRVKMLGEFAFPTATKLTGLVS